MIVLDRGGAVVRAEIVEWQGPRALWRLPGGLFVGLPRGDGSLRLVCRGGAVRGMGYVSAATHIWFEVPKSAGCAGAREMD